MNRGLNAFAYLDWSAIDVHPAVDRGGGRIGRNASERYCSLTQKESRPRWRAVRRLSASTQTEATVGVWKVESYPFKRGNRASALPRAIRASVFGSMVRRWKCSVLYPMDIRSKSVPNRICVEGVSLVRAPKFTSE
jgi:hypothetical protein